MSRKALIWSTAMCLVFAMGQLRGDLTEGLVGYWPLDGDGVDEWDNGIDGVVNGDVMPVEDRFGNEDSALLFPGSPDGHVDLGDHEAFRITGALTLAAWINLDPENGGRNGRIVAKQGGGGARSWSLNTENAGVPGTFQVASDPGTIVSLGDVEPLPQGEWVHLAGVFRPGESMELYVDGELRVLEEFGVPDEHFSDNGLSVLIGARNACGNCGWLGAIDEVAIWSRDLDEDEVVQVMESESLLEPPEVDSTAFRRGDADDNGSVNITDAVAVLNFLFGGGGALACEEVADVNNDGQVNITDPVRLLNHLFGDAPPPESPGLETCGPDPADEMPKMEDGTTLGCAGYSSC